MVEKVTDPQAALEAPAGYRIPQEATEIAVEARWPGLAAAVAGNYTNALEGGYEAFLASRSPKEIAIDMMLCAADIEVFADGHNGSALVEAIAKIILAWPVVTKH